MGWATWMNIRYFKGNNVWQKLKSDVPFCNVSHCTHRVPEPAPCRKSHSHGQRQKTHPGGFLTTAVGHPLCTTPKQRQLREGMLTKAGSVLHGLCFFPVYCKHQTLTGVEMVLATSPNLHTVTPLQQLPALPSLIFPPIPRLPLPEVISRLLFFSSIKYFSINF